MFKMSIKLTYTVVDGRRLAPITLVDQNSRATSGLVIFPVVAKERELFRSKALKRTSEP